jgi:hypothetical protein
MHIALARQHLWLDAQRFMTKLISLCLCGAGWLAGGPRIFACAVHFYFKLRKFTSLPCIF